MGTRFAFVAAALACMFAANMSGRTWSKAEASLRTWEPFTRAMDKTPHRVVVYLGERAHPDIAQLLSREEAKKKLSQRPPYVVAGRDENGREWKIDHWQICDAACGREATLAANAMRRASPGKMAAYGLWAGFGILALWLAWRVGRASRSLKHLASAYALTLLLLGAGIVSLLGLGALSVRELSPSLLWTLVGSLERAAAMGAALASSLLLFPITHTLLRLRGHALSSHADDGLVEGSQLVAPSRQAPLARSSAPGRLKSPLRKVCLAALVVLFALVAVAWTLLSREVRRNADALAQDVSAAERIAHERPVHRLPAHPGSVTQCYESLLGHFSSISPSRSQDEWDENRLLCLGEISVSELSEESRKRIVDFSSWRARVGDCTHASEVPPGIAPRFSDSNQGAAQAFDSLQVQMHLSSCAAVAGFLEEGHPAAALAECADSFAFLRDEVILGVAARVGDAASMGLPLAVLCGAAIDESPHADRARFASEIRLIRAGLPSKREIADRQRLRLSLWRYRPLMPPSSRSRLPPALQPDGQFDVKYEGRLLRKLAWTSSDRLLRAAVDVANQPASPARAQNLANLYQSISRGTLRGDDKAMLQVIHEIESWDLFDAVLAMLAAAADFDTANPKEVTGSEFAVDVDEASVQFRLLLPVPSEVLVVLNRT